MKEKLWYDDNGLEYCGYCYTLIPSGKPKFCKRCGTELDWGQSDLSPDDLCGKSRQLESHFDIEVPKSDLNIDKFKELSQDNCIYFPTNWDSYIIRVNSLDTLMLLSNCIGNDVVLSQGRMSVTGLTLQKYECCKQLV